MIPEIGHFSLIIALLFAVLQFLLPFISAIGLLSGHTLTDRFLQAPRSLCIGLCWFVTLALFCLVVSFLNDDFSVQYVVTHSNSALPFKYKLAAAWGGHEGSWLLWIWVLSLWNAWVGIRSRQLSLTLSSGILAVLGVLATAFLLFLLFTSNPFTRYLPDFPIDGQDLNPLLQDLGMLWHPPLLYIGYVGFSVPFAFAIAVLWLGKVESQWFQWLKAFCLTTWAFLTIGIMWGSFWAYYELGWGGWWFWDPVENASFMPWLLGIALIHSMIISVKRKERYGWTLLLCIACFAFSLLGAFLVRSGLLSSVHAFANDPKRGRWLLSFLLFVVLYSVLLLWMRAKKTLQVHPTTPLAPFSRETLIFSLILLLMTAVFSILMGTLYPFIHEIFFKQKISVGYPYFNMIFIPLMIPILILIPLGPFTRWGQDHLLKVMKALRWPLWTSLMGTILLPLIWLHWEGIRQWSLLAFLGLWLGLWICLGTFERLWIKAKGKGIKGWTSMSLGAWGMGLAHIGVGLLVIGITLVSQGQIEREVLMDPGQSIDIGNYRVTFKNLKMNEGSNFIGYQGEFLIEKANLESKKDTLIQKARVLYPEKRIFVTRDQSMTETALDAGWFRDLYIALGNPQNQSDRWSVRIYYKPFIRWIWVGCIFMALGALLSAFRKSKA